MAYDGFRFEYTRPDVSAPGGRLKTHYIAVEQSLEAAIRRTGELVGNPRDLRLLDSGPSVLAEAKKRGIGEGQASVL
jgi:hypothetical protein